MFEFLPPEPNRTTRRAFLLSASAAALGLGSYAYAHARHEMEVVRQTVRIQNLPDAFVGFRIAQLSDIHLVEWTEPWFLLNAVDRINELNPDAVALTGDFVSRGPFQVEVAMKAMPVCAEILSVLRAPLRFAILGNHDTAVDDRLVIRCLRDHGIPTLVDMHYPVDLNGDRLWFCGVNDPGTTDPSLDKAIPANPKAPVILLAHEPDYADGVRHHPNAPFIDLMLSGHTHGGQVRLPFIGPLVLPPMGQRYVQGLFRFPEVRMQLYVNRGIGATGVPFRLNCRPEVTEITLQRA